MNRRNYLTGSTSSMRRRHSSPGPCFGGGLDLIEGLLLNLFHAYFVSVKYAKIRDGARCAAEAEAEKLKPVHDEKIGAGAFPN